MNTTTILLIALAFIILYLITTYNSFILKRNSMRNAFATIDVMLKRRFDLIPSLVTIVKQYATHEQETLIKLTEIRSRSYEQLSENEKILLDSNFTQARQTLTVVSENYPQLKAADNFIQLQRALNETEEQLAASRRTYNATVTEYNNAAQTFPSNLIAQLFHFESKQLLLIPQNEREAPTTSFN